MVRIQSIFEILQGPSAEIELKKGDTIKVSTNAEYSEKGSAEVIFVDYANIVKVVVINSRIFIDDGLISIIVKEIGTTSCLVNGYVKIMKLNPLAFGC